MTTAEIKLDLFRKIDKLRDSELRKVYQDFLSLLSPSEKYILTSDEEKAVNEALDSSKGGRTFSHESVMEEAKSRYPQLKFK